MAVRPQEVGPLTERERKVAAWVEERLDSLLLEADSDGPFVKAFRGSISDRVVRDILRVYRASGWICSVVREMNGRVVLRLTKPEEVAAETETAEANSVSEDDADNGAD